MKTDARTSAFPKRAPALPVAAAMLFFLSACASATIEDAVPRGALASDPTPTASGITNAAVTDADLVTAPQASPAAEQDTAAFTSGPRNTGQYPNLNLPQRAAAEQITYAQKVQMMHELAGAKQRQAASAGTTAAAAAEAARLRSLATGHAQRALEEIEQAE